MVSYKYRFRKIRNAQDVAAYRLCSGCGACFGICPQEKIRLVDIEDDGIRPFLSNDTCGSCDLCLRVCPGIDTSISSSDQSLINPSDANQKKWGRFVELWEGYASNPETRFRGSSGGLCTALAMFSVEQGFASGVLHVGSDSENPVKNKTIRSKSHAELLSRAGSRYSPAAPCQGFAEIERAGGQSVFIGKPCDVAGLRMAQKLRPSLVEKVALTIGFFCAGTPSTQGTIDLLGKYGVHPSEIADLRYRGMGWPGMTTAAFKDKALQALKMTYNESWGFIQKYRPSRCYLCPDLTAQFADISVGDPWYREIGQNEMGRSLILIRTETGRRFFYSALKLGFVTAVPANADLIDRSQKNLLGKRQEIWGRLFAMKILGIPYPKLEGFFLLENWMQLSTLRKLKSILGTMRRIVQRKYYKPKKFNHK